MKPQTTADYYAILEVPELADPDAIKSAYRRLARLRHPDKDAKNPQATANFQALQDAYSTLSDPLKRRDYDVIYPSIRLARTGNRQWGPQASQAEARSSWGPGRSPTSHSPDTAEMRAHKQKLEELEKQLRQLSQQRTGLNNDLYDAKHKLATKQSTLERLRTEVAQEARDEAARKGWFGFFYRLTVKQQEERDRSATARKTGKIVVEAQVEQCKNTVSNIESQLNGVSARVGQISCEVAATNRRYEQAKLAEEQRLRAEQFRRECEAQKEWQRQTKARQEAEAEAEARRKREEAAKTEGERWRAEQAKMSRQGKGLNKQNKRQDEKLKLKLAARGRRQQRLKKKDEKPSKQKRRLSRQGKGLNKRERRDKNSRLKFAAGERRRRRRLRKKDRSPRKKGERPTTQRHGLKEQKESRAKRLKLVARKKRHANQRKRFKRSTEKRRKRASNARPRAHMERKWQAPRGVRQRVTTRVAIKTGGKGSRESIGVSGASIRCLDSPCVVLGVR